MSKTTLDASDVFRTMCPTLDNLANRWADEKEYEDFNDYKIAVKKALPKPAEFRSMSSRPFRLVFAIGKALFSITVKGNGIFLANY